MLYETCESGGEWRRGKGKVMRGACCMRHASGGKWRRGEERCVLYETHASGGE